MLDRVHDHSWMATFSVDFMGQRRTDAICHFQNPEVRAACFGKMMAAAGWHLTARLLQAEAALEHSYDLDLARCYYTATCCSWINLTLVIPVVQHHGLAEVRCAMYLVESCVEGQP